MCITSPPYWKLRDYENDGQIGNESSFEEYLNKLIEIFDEVFRVLKDGGSCWVNIGDVYSSNNNVGVKRQSLIGIPDRFKIKMIDNGWICRNEIIWHKPNAMPSSAKTRFNNDYEKMFFFTKTTTYFFNTQYEEAKTKIKTKSNITKKNNTKSKYYDEDHEKSVRQGMSSKRGTQIIEVRRKLPSQDEFVNFLRERVTINDILNNSDLVKTKVEHWFRRDKSGFSFPSVDDWNKIKFLLNDGSELYNLMDEKITYVEFETDDINKNSHKGRIKRSVWSINTVALKDCHFAAFPEKLIETPINSCCPDGGIVLDIFMGSGTTAIVSKKLNKNYVGIEINKNYVEIAKKRLSEIK